jgi:class 3 adenylate cyclase
MSDSPLEPGPTPDSISSRTLEIAHVLFTDIVGYSKLPMDKQKQLLMQLQDAVRQTPEFIRAETREELIRLPTGDGMALVFFRDPEAPVRCALELSRALRSYPEIKLRMGIHSGPVYRIADINANRNVAGGGINIAQRVMDCGDAGHILVSEEVAKVLTQIGVWKGHLHDLGDAEVKHSVRVHLFNLCTEDAGNSSLPQKLNAATAHSTENALKSRRISTRRQIAFILASFALCAVVIWAGYARFHHLWIRSTAGMSGMTITRITNNGESRRAAISPDGKYVAYVIEDANKQSLWVRQRSTASDVQIVQPTEAVYWDVLFSPDSNYVYFTRSPVSLPGLFSLFRTATLYRVPTLGGALHEVISTSALLSRSPQTENLYVLGKGY